MENKLDYKELNLKRGDILTAKHIAHIEKGIDDITAEVDVIKSWKNLLFNINDQKNKQFVMNNKGELTWEERSHFSYEDNFDFFPETTLFKINSDDSYYVSLTNPLKGDPIVGNEYKFTCDGKTYTVKTTQFFIGDSIEYGAFLGWGNLSALGIEQESGEDVPFALVIFPNKAAAELGVSCLLATSTSSDQVIVKIEGLATFVKPLDAKYLKNLRGQETLVFLRKSDTEYFVPPSDFEYVWEKTSSELQNAIQIIDEETMKCGYSASFVEKKEYNERFIHFLYFSTNEDGQPQINWVHWSESYEPELVGTFPLNVFNILEKAATPYIVNLTIDQGNQYSVDHYANEIYSAFSQGRRVYLAIDNSILNLSYALPTKCQFSGIYPEEEGAFPIFYTINISNTNVEVKLASLQTVND